MILLAGLAFSLRPIPGTLVVEVREPGVRIEILDAQGKVEVSRKAFSPGMITSLIAAGKHRLVATKDGFETFTREFDIAGGRTHEIAAEIVVQWTTIPQERSPTSFWIFTSPISQTGMKRVAGLPAEQQVAAVADRLGRASTTDLTGKLRAYAFENRDRRGGASVSSDNVTDLSPLRAFTGLKELTCYAINTTNALADVSPLRGWLCPSSRLGWSQVVDLSLPGWNAADGL